MKKILAILLIPGFSLGQDYSFSSANISGNLNAETLTVDNVVVDNSTIGYISDTDLITVSDGLLTVTGDLTTLSDKNLKINIESLGSVLTKLIKLNPKSYTINNDLDQKIKIGLLAQEVEQVFPELVDKTGEYMAVNYQALIPVLINALNEQANRNKSLIHRIEVLRSKIE